MAGTLTISTLSDGTNSTSATNPIMGSAKAWVNFNGTGTVAIRASYNVSSITDNGTGDYTINFTNAFSDANYAVVYGYGQTAAASAWKVCTLVTTSEGATPTLKTTTQLRMMSGGSNAYYDYGQIDVVCFR